MIKFLYIVALAVLTYKLQLTLAETEADEERRYVRGDVKLSLSVVTGDRAATLAALAAGARPNMMLTKEIGEDRLKLGKAGRDFLVAPVAHVAMSGILTEHLEVANLLIRVGANPIESSLDRIDAEEEFAPGIMYPLGYHVQVNNSRAALLQRLLLTYPQKFNMSAVNAWANATRRSPAMHCAIEANFYDGVYVLLTLSKQSDEFIYDINERNMLNQTGLIVAAMRGNAEIAKLMVHNDVRILFYDKLKRTALHMAATYGRTSVIDAVLAARRDFEVLRHLCERKDIFGRTALDLASLAPVRRGTVRMLRSKLTAVGVVPHTAPWLNPPLREYANGEAHGGDRHISVLYKDAMERSQDETLNLAWRLLDPSFVSMTEYVSTNSTWAAGDIDAVYRSTPWAQDLASSWLARHYISANRPVLLLPDASGLRNMEAFLGLLQQGSDDLLDAFSPTSSISYHRSANLAPKGISTSSTSGTGTSDSTTSSGTYTRKTSTGIEERINSLRGELFLSQNRVITPPKFSVIRNRVSTDTHVSVEVGVHSLQNLDSEVTSMGDTTSGCAFVPSDDLFELNIPEDQASIFKYFYTNGRIASELNENWCVAAHQSANSTAIAIGDFGAAAYGSIELQSYVHISLVAGARHWYIFPPVDNATAVSWQWEVISNATEALSSGPSSPNIAAMMDYMSKEKATNVKGVEFYEIDQFPGDVVFIPGGWSYLYVNLLDAVSVSFGNCMLNAAVPNCIRQTIDTNNDVAYMGR